MHLTKRNKAFIAEFLTLYESIWNLYYINYRFINVLTELDMIYFQEIG